jgi:hypothetical protein
MIDRLRTALVESFVGTILVGWLFAEALIHAVRIITNPLVMWEAQAFARTLSYGTGSTRPPTERFPWSASLPEALSAVLLLLVAYALLRWLFYDQTPPVDSSSER